MSALTAASAVSASSPTPTPSQPQPPGRGQGTAPGRAPVQGATGPEAGTTAERRVTRGPGGRILTNTGVWSPDSQWIVYDTRSDPAGDLFDGRRIEMVQVETGDVRTIYESGHGAFCGVATFHPLEREVVFILGPEHPTPDWSYNAWHRQGVLVAADPARLPGRARPLDARDVVPPFTPGALRGGSHVHVWNATGDWLSFTYEDHVLASLGAAAPAAPGAAASEPEPNQRNIGVSVRGRPVRVPPGHPRNHDGEAFSVLVTRTVARPRPGTDEISRACEEGWVGTRGYRRADGSWQRRALAFQGTVAGGAAGASPIAEVFIVDLPDDLSVAGDGPLEGTPSRRPVPPRGVVQRRLTRTADWRHPGIQGPRHWLRASPDGAAIAFLARDEDGVVQFWTVSPEGGPPRQVTRNATGIASAFTWTPDGRGLAHVMDGSVCLTEVATGVTRRLTPKSGPADGELRPEACVVSPDGRWIAVVRRVAHGGDAGGASSRDFSNQICVVAIPGR